LAKTRFGKLNERSTQVGQQHLQPNAADDDRLERAAQKNIGGDGGDIGRCEHLLGLDRQRPLRLDAFDARRDQRILQDELFDILLAHPERNGFGEMQRRPIALVEREMRGGEIVMTGRVQGIGSDGARQRLHREPVAAGRLRDDAEEVEREHVRRRLRENPIA